MNLIYLKIKTALGSLDIGRGKYLVRIPGEYTNAKEIEDIVVTVKNGIPVYLRDVARVLNL